MKRKFIIYVAIATLIILASGCNATKDPVVVIPGEEEEPDTPGTPQPDKASVGKVIPAWIEGCFDIHFINTQMGECTFLIFPDGTQMIIDAAGSATATGVVGSTTNVGIRKRWDPTRDATFNCNQFIAEYIRKCMAWTGNNTIDYALVTHFHNDHYGAHLGLPTSPNSTTYREQSMVYILENFNIGKLMDRGYPEYDYPFDLSKYYTDKSESSVYNWITAVKWLVGNKGLKAEKFIAGSNSQVVQLRKASEYPNFSTRNIGVNGEVWTGIGTNTKNTFPDKSAIQCANPPSVVNGDACPEENHVSAVMKFTYGSFDYWAGADLQYDGMSNFGWKDIETPMAQVGGVVDVMKADHHGVSNTNGAGYKNKAWAMKYLDPTCWIVNSWTDGHPRQTVFEDVTGYCPNLNVFITNTCDSQKAYKDYSKFVKGADGHVVVRVYPGGTMYYVYTLNDSDHSMSVKQITGPIKSK